MKTSTPILKSAILIIASILTCFIFSKKIEAVGISPGRRTYGLQNNLVNGWDTQIEYWLYEPSERQYSTFSISGSLGPLYDIHADINPNNQSQILIDWALIDTNSTSAFVNLHLDPGWLIPDGPGHQLLIRDAVRHAEADPDGGGIGAISSVVSQLYLYQNYAPDLQISAPENILVNEEWPLNVNVTDFHDAPNFRTNNAQSFSYQIDWDGDGEFDESLTGLPYYNEFGEIVDDFNLSGFASGEFSVVKTFSDAGNHSVVLSVSDSMDSTTIEIPVNVAVPIPSAILLFSSGLAGLLGLKRKFRKRKN